MCGIIGSLAIGLNAPLIERSRVEIARDKMQTRGPDAAGLWEDPEHRIILAHRRLSIIDLSEDAHQPFISSCGRFAIVFNGEIYNYKEIRNELKAKGYRFRTNSDTEVLLISCIEYGDGVCKYLRGMFAFAFWDVEKKSLILARDHFGIKPLYFANYNGHFHFASQVSALIDLEPLLKTEPSLAGHVGFFLWGHVPCPFTLYNNIRSIYPGQILQISHDGHLKKRDYFDAAAHFAGNIEINNSYDDIIESVTDSVKSHLVADVPVGVFLSAGIDSSVIASAAAQVQKGIQTLTLGFPEYRNTLKDETIQSRRSADLLDTTHVERWIEKSDFSKCIENVINAMDQPTIDGVNTFFICREAKNAGLKVVLSGLGGDEMFRGYPSFQDVPRLYNLSSSFGPLTRPLGSILRKILWPIVRKGPHYKYAGILELGDSYTGAYHLRRGLFMPWEISDLFGSRKTKDGLEELSEEDHIGKSLSDISDPVLKVQLLEMTRYLSNCLLRDSDWASMAHSVELRVPFIDISLFSTVLNAALKAKPYYKHNLAPVMPQEISFNIFKRKKTGFNIPVQNWIEPDRKDKRLTLKQWATFVYTKKSGDLNFIIHK